VSEVRAGSLFAALPLREAAERVDDLLAGGPFRLLRIVSSGQATPPGEWYDQADDEWVVLLRGAAAVRLAAEAAPRRLAPGDWLLLPAGCRHRVEWTAPDGPTVWLALHHLAQGGDR
jgi:cupin 2 domain-containing protein